MKKDIRIQVVVGGELSSDARDEIVSFCSRAFEEDMAPLFETFRGATHVLAHLGTTLVSHVLWVTRWLQAGSSPLMRTAYVEALATEKAYRGRGYGSRVMRRFADEIRCFDLGGLSPSDPRFYERLGWELWRGPLFIRKDNELLPTPEEEQVMVMRLPRTPPLDLAGPLSAEWRDGELW
jgi:aminoglycoside 2'-N-acetyltransferase I